ncbi:hypothetical protein ES288_D13G172600v1 [Gossypium darwinii]|uniref:Uncharacterized protein n=1 Tax=Gossypium darwinii TaxID=34276 RepID=A0A5D2A1Q9_GOSDA|nr:hypothetical protein ES288_D13G172600v1 [Gossypium darwinii]
MLRALAAFLRNHRKKLCRFVRGFHLSSSLSRECLKLIPHEKFSFAKVIIDIECFSPISLGFGSLNPPIVSTSKNAASPSILRISPNHASFKLTKVIESKCTIEYVGFSLIFYFCTISARLTLKFVAVPDGLKAWEMLKGRPHNVDLIVTKWICHLYQDLLFLH